MHNVASFLPALFGALDRQTFTDWEVVAMDDGSTDDSLAVAKRFAESDSRIRVFSRPCASGAPLLPRLEAARLARGEWVCPLDADDWVDDDYLERLLQRARETGADIVYGQMLNHRVDPGANSTPVFNPSVMDWEKIYMGRDLVRHTLYCWEFGCNGALYRRDLYVEGFQEVADLPPLAHPFPGGLSHTATPYIDEIATRGLMMRASKVAFAREARYHYITNPESVVDSPALTQFRGLATDWYLREWIRSHYGEESPEWKRMHLQMASDVVSKMIAYHRNGHLLTPQVRRQCHALLSHAHVHFPHADAAPSLTLPYRLLLRLPLPLSMRLFSWLKR